MTEYKYTFACPCCGEVLRVEIVDRELEDGRVELAMRDVEVATGKSNLDVSRGLALPPAPKEEVAP